MSTEAFLIEVDDKGSINRVVRDLGNLGRAGESVQRTALGIGTALKAVATGLAVNEVRKSIDAYTELRNSLVSVTQSSAQLGQVHQALRAVTLQTLTPTAQLAATYKELAGATGEYGLSTKQLVGLTRTLSEAFALEGSQGIGAFAAALDRGTVSSREMKSILQENQPIADALKDKFHATSAELIILAEHGRVAGSDLLEAVGGAQEKIQENFDRLEPTVSQVFGLVIDEGRNATAELIRMALGGDKATASLRKFPATARESFAVLAEAGGRGFDAISDFTHQAIGSFDEFGATVTLTFHSVLNEVYRLVNSSSAALDSLNFAAFKAKYALGLANANARPADLATHLAPFDLTKDANALSKSKVPFSPSTSGAAFGDQLASKIRATTKAENDMAGAVEKETRATATSAAAQREHLARFSARLTLTDRIREETNRLANLQGDLNALLKEGAITEGEFNRELRQAGISADTLSAAFEGLSSSFSAVDLGLGALGRSIGDELVGSLDTASKALADFALSGFRNLDDFRTAAAKMLEDLGRDLLAMAIKAALAKLIVRSVSGISGLFGGADTGTGAGADFGGELTAGGGASSGSTFGLADGGSVFPGRPTLVGELGPEVYTPNAGGTITPNDKIGRSAPQAPPTVNVLFTTEDVTSAMSTSQGESTIVRAIVKNRQALKGILS